jgi:CHASE2 domain-containing sensor protein
MSLKKWKWSWPKYWLVLLAVNGLAFVVSWSIRDYANSLLTMGMFIFCAAGFFMSSEDNEDER